MTEITKAVWVKAARVIAIYDGDTLVVDIDLYDHIWKHDEVIRLYGINANEIKKSTRHGRDQAHVDKGFDHRDELIEALGLDPDDFPRKVKYQDVSESILEALDIDGDGEPDVFDYREFPKPVPIIIETVKDRTGKFGRMLGIIHKNGQNINEHLRDIIGGVEFYDGKEYPPDYPIRPPE